MSKKSNPKNRSSNPLFSFISGRYFFTLTLVFFVIQSIWTALIGLYPMAFDEDTHLGIIRFFAQHSNPFFSQQPDYLNQYGPIAHDPSYLYRYLMSFPWRAITFITDNFTVQVILMRFINIGLFVLGLIIFRKLLLLATSNRLLVNLALLLVVLTPNSSQLAAQINYDNLLIPLMAASLWVAVKFVSKLKENKPDPWLATWFIVLAASASLTKFTYITILLPTLIYMGWHLINFYRRRKKRIWRDISNSFKATSRWQAAAMIVLVIFSSGLFIERYAGNIARYHTPTPSCVKIIGPVKCQDYSIYQRDILYKQSKLDNINKNPFLFTYRWLKHMNYNLMMALSGPYNGYAVGQPLPLPYTASIIFGITGIILCAVYFRKVFNNSALRLFILILAVYLGLLWITNYGGYVSTGRRLAIQGRYLVPFLPIFYLCFLMAYQQLLKHWPKIRISLATILILAFLWGGGVLPYILHSDNTWYWSNNAFVDTNLKLKNILKYVVPDTYDNSKPYIQSSYSF
jgi:hypothetical protein